MFTDVKPDNYYIIIINYLQLLKGKPVCLVCGADVAVMKEYHLRRQYVTKLCELSSKC